MSAHAQTEMHGGHGDAGHGDAGHGDGGHGGAGHGGAGHGDGHGAGHGHGGADHVPHVLPMSMYIGTFLALMVLTLTTVGVSYVDLGVLNIVVALLVATIKATIVGAIFMHLFWDHKFHTIIFASSIIFLAIFIGFTMADTNGRGLADAIEAERPANVAMPFAGTRSEEKLKKKYAAAAAAAAAVAPVAPAAAAAAAPVAPVAPVVPAPVVPAPVVPAPVVAPAPTPLAPVPAAP